MNTQQENIIVDSCQYTPVYLVQNTGAIQGRPYIVAQSNVEEAKPVSDNLKRFYESSGILENNFVNNVPSISKPRILKKQDSKHVGNNLKLASFLLPKGTQEPNLNKQCLSVNNVVLKQVVGGNVMNPVPKVEVVSANVVNTPQVEIVANMVNSSPKVELLTTNVINNIPKVELLPANTMNNIPKVELLPANVNNIPKVELVSTNVVNSASKVELITTNVVNCNTVPKVEVDRKIVKLKNFPNALRTPPRDKPKIRPRVTVEDSPNPNTNATKHTSVQLLKLGETYHSLNQLSDSQMKMVNQALKIFSNPEKTSKEPTYDPVTNTRFIYKVVSPRDLTVVGKNKIKKDESNTYKKESKKVIEDPEPEPVVPVEVKMTRSGRKVKFPKQIVPDNTPPPPKPKKKSTGAVVSCFQCSTEFCSLYRLQKHYENQPTHLPAKVHSNLFHCLLAIIKSGSEEDRTNIFIQQLEQLIEKLRSLLPCLMKKIDGSVGKSCTINDDIGRLFGMSPGKYNLNTDALTCVKDKDGNCRHNPPPKNQFNSNLNKPSQLWLSKHNEEIANVDNGTEDCARINAVDRWPTANKRIRNSKQQKNMKSEIKAKKMRLSSENSEAIIELEDLVNFNAPNNQNAINVQPKSLTILDDIEIVNEPLVIKDEQSTITDLPKKTKSAPAQFTLSTPKDHSAINVQPLSLLDNLHEVTEDCIEQPLASKKPSNVNEKPIKKEKAHTQFHSAHFDIRSSPIKSSSAATFRKFQINFEKIGKFEVQKLDINETEEEESEPQLQDCVMQPQANDDSEDLNSLFRDDIVAMACKDPHEIPHDLNAFEATKDWICSGLNAIMEKTDDNFMKTNSLDESFIRGNSLIEPALLHLKEDTLDKLPISNELTGDHLTDSDNRLLSNQSSSVLNFLDSLGSECLSYPETEIRNNTVDFQLDLFSFSNT